MRVLFQRVPEELDQFLLDNREIRTRNLLLVSELARAVRFLDSSVCVVMKLGRLGFALGDLLLHVHALVLLRRAFATAARSLRAVGALSLGDLLLHVHALVLLR